jgi:hypothetical protein
MPKYGDEKCLNVDEIRSTLSSIAQEAVSDELRFSRIF